MKEDVYLIDASIYIFKSYFSYGDEFIAANGAPINAVYGFTRFLTQFIHQTKPKYIACCFDESLDISFRNEIFPAYKANREPAPADLKRQFKLCQEVANIMGVATFRDGYYEADDLIGTLAKHYQDLNHSIHIISADKDLAQLIGQNDKWWNYGKASPFSPLDVYEKFGVHPHQIADFLALTGDSVDNIPGVPGIGTKTAGLLLSHFKSLDDIISRNQEIKYLSFRGAKSCQKKIANNITAAKLAKKLTLIKQDIELDNFDLLRNKLDLGRVEKLFEYLKFGPLLRRKILEIEHI
jgi:5'-3' exonuclease